MRHRIKLPDFELSNEASRIDAKELFDGNLVFGAKKFHKSTFRSDEKTRGSPADGAMHREQALVVRETGQERYQRIDEFWEPVDNCPVCHSAKRDFFISRFALDIYECLNCTHYYMHPRIKFDKLVELYACDKTAAKIYKSDMQMGIDRAKAAYGLSLLEKIGPPDKKKIMDLGCGSGLFLTVAHESGWTTCVGVDANDEFKDVYSDEHGIQYISSTFEALDSNALGDAYDVITLWNVLEHLYDLDGIVAKLKELLKPGGLLFIMVPNVKSLATRIIRERSATFNWKHVSHFSTKSLKMLMQKQGLECEFLETAITEIDNIKSYLSGAWPYSGVGDPEALFEFITPEYLHKNHLGSRIIGVFRA